MVRAKMTVTLFFLLLARLLKDKGVQELANAARLLKSSYPGA
jgi:hypothetical protein